MQKPNNYENTQASGDFIPVELGGHYAVIKQQPVLNLGHINPEICPKVSFRFFQDHPDAFPGFQARGIQIHITVAGSGFSDPGELSNVPEQIAQSAHMIHMRMRNHNFTYA